LVSVIVPVYNGELYLGSALQSIMEQDYHPLEVIVVDDGSVDGSREVAKSFKEVRYIYQTNQGQAQALNVGAEAARGEFLAFMDADDLWAPNKLAVQAGYLMEHPECGFTISRIQNFIDSSLEMDKQLENSPLLMDEVSLMALVVRKRVFEQLGGFDPSYRVGADMDWHFRAKDAGIRMAVLPEVLLYRRIHNSNMSLDMEARRSNVARAIKASIDRMRKQT
jgi:glycosyltransferase involved in cell wall biosynthesis